MQQLSFGNIALNVSSIVGVNIFIGGVCYAYAPEIQRTRYISRFC